MLTTSSSSSSEDLDFCDLEEVPRVSKDLLPQAKRKRGRRTIITPKLAAALDKCKISDRNAVHILAAAIEALGYNVENFAINRCSIHNFRENLREQKAAEIKNIFKDRKLHAATLHWDGKLLPALTGKETVDRLSVILSNCGTDQLLGIPSLQSGNGKKQATAVCETLAEWGLQDYVKALVFDTTASNTGTFKGACVLIENFLEKDLLYLPCRHHMYEIILKAIYEEKMGKTTGPTVPILKNGINVNNFKTGIEHEKVKENLDPVDVSRILDFVQDALQEL
ncbi:uncharacterized protein LOC125777157 [Bactrocera dorsalis]|uniref:Uncharacterized protein LOC125777157 n=1 Tax=Bactrocera dorsalis TaxID=27457 RepID=A0ABM3JDR4_BACDO|nr:uncharacterized protein LOC125777157 [Bactrocera dorsalis]